MAIPQEIGKRINKYLAAVESNLRGTPEAEGREILSSLKAHIHDALAARAGDRPTAEDVEAVLVEMDPPESYGPGSQPDEAPIRAEAEATGGKRPAANLANWALGLMILGILVAGCLIAAAVAIEDPPKGPIVFLALALGAIFELLALALGIANRREQAGKAAAIGAV
ncbi:MAG: HAAS signaling domain-containing protein, partial [Planctomycetota bacterium]